MSYSENPGPQPIRIAVVEDDKTVREGLQMLLNGSPGFTCVAAYGKGKTLWHNYPK